MVGRGGSGDGGGCGESEGSGGLERLALDVAGIRRTYWLARAPGLTDPAPLLIVLHGFGTSGRDVATTFTRLATRSPAAGVTAVFPDGWRGVWHVTGAPADQPDLDDAAFLRALTAHLPGAAPPGPIFLAGISNGAGFAEHMARHGLLPLAGLFGVSGTIREASRQAAPVPAQRIAVTLMAGTADPMAPYQGGPLHARGVSGWMLRRRAARHGDLPSQRRIVPVETAARDWAAGNGITGEPAVTLLPSEHRPAGPSGSPGPLRAARRWCSTGSRAAGTAGRAAAVLAGPRYRSDPPASRCEQILLDMIAAG